MNRIPAILFVALVAVSPAPAQVPSILNYQGRVTVGGTNLTTNAALFKFALVSGDGTAVYWKNDGTTTTNEPSSAVTVTTAQGLYSTLLGDTTLSNMAAIPAAVFTNGSVNLRVWFKSGTNAFVRLSPDQRLGASGYALRAASADAAAVTNVAGNLTVTGLLTATQIVSGSGNMLSGSNPVIGGGLANTASGNYSTVSGGLTNTASGLVSTAGGGAGNSAIARGATVAGGRLNSAGNDDAAVGGGYNNAATGVASAVGGGFENQALGDSSTVGGGFRNGASANEATVGGGAVNVADGGASTVGGGNNNRASQLYATVGGGDLNSANGLGATVGGGSTNSATANYASLGGGINNTASGDRATIPGGSSNEATTNSFAAGNRAKARSAGSFVWADAQDADFVSAGTNSFNVRASGGAFIRGDSNSGRLTIFPDTSDRSSQILLSENTTRTIGMVVRYDGTAANNPLQFIGLTNGAETAPILTVTRSGRVGVMQATPASTFQVVNATCDGSTWVNSSDRNLKTSFEAVDSAEVLRKVTMLPISEWTYKNSINGSRHIGPTAQDFRAVFGLGDNDRTISTIDPSGVALAAIQGLFEELKDRDKAIDELKDEVRALREQMRNSPPPTDR